MGQASAIALSISAVSLAAAAVGVLLRRTAGRTGIQRLRTMARLTIAAVWGVLPPQWAVASVAAGLLAFVATLAVGVVVTVVIVRVMPRQVPNPTEAYEGIGDALMAEAVLSLGAGLSFVAACIVGVVTGSWMTARWVTGGVPNPDIVSDANRHKADWDKFLF